MWTANTRTYCSLMFLMTIYFLCSSDVLTGYYSSAWVFTPYFIFMPLSSSSSLQHFVLAWSKFHVDDICMFTLIYQHHFEAYFYPLKSLQPSTFQSLMVFMHNSYSAIQDIAKVFNITRPRIKSSKMQHKMTHRD